MEQRINKYVRFEKAGFFVWPRVYPDPNDDPVAHKYLAHFVETRGGGKPISAGFCFIRNGQVLCWGGSQSLNLENKEEDSALLTKQLYG